MEPQLEGCGKRVPEGAPIWKAVKLQWSRNLRVAESRCERCKMRRLHRFNGAAT